MNDVSYFNNYIMPLGIYGLNYCEVKIYLQQFNK